MHNRLYLYRHWLVALWMMAFAAFHMAWTSHPAAAFTLNAFDLAEQISIHPAIRAESPPLRSSAMLWFAIPMIAAGMTVSALLYKNMLIRYTLHAAAFLMALRIIPPEGALRSPRMLLDDDYARLLTLLTLIGVGAVFVSIILRKRILRRLTAIQLTLGALALIIPAVGFSNAYDLLQQLQLDISPGGGVVIYAGVLVVLMMRVTPLVGNSDRQSAEITHEGIGVY